MLKDSSPFLDCHQALRKATLLRKAMEVAVLEGKTRIPPVDIETLPEDVREVFEEQRKRWGAPLYPYLYYARNPAYFRAAHAMWTALQQETKRVLTTDKGRFTVSRAELARQ
jgi:hypothetical protein